MNVVTALAVGLGLPAHVKPVGQVTVYGPPLATCFRITTTSWPGVKFAIVAVGEILALNAVERVNVSLVPAVELVGVNAGVVEKVIV